MTETVHAAERTSLLQQERKKKISFYITEASILKYFGWHSVVS